MFHWRCLNKYAEELPPGTDPLNYSCPDCHKSVFPSVNVTTPVAQQLRKQLTGVEWARTGLAQSTADSQSILPRDEANLSYDNLPHVVKHNLNNSGNSIPVPVNNYFNNASESVNYARKHHDSTGRESDAHVPLLDADDNKYRKKSPLEFLSRWFR